MIQSSNGSMTQFFQQRLCLLQVLRVKPFGEPVVDLGQHVACFVVLSLSLPQASEASGGTQFPIFCALATGNLDSLLKTRLGFRLDFGLALTCSGLVFDLFGTCL